MPDLLCRLSACEQSLGEWLASLLPEFGRAERRQWVDARAASIDGQALDRIGATCPPGARLQVVALPEGAWSEPDLRTHSSWQVWVDDPPWPGGTLPLAKGGRIDFSVAERSAGLARLELVGHGLASAEIEGDTILERLADARMPVVGDLRRGGLAKPGGACLAGAAEALADPLTAGDAAWPEASPALVVSKEAARALSRGHPWLLPDEASDSATRFRPGTLLRVEDRRSRSLGWAWAEGTAEVSARMAQTGEGDRRAVASVEARVAKAVGRRAVLLAGASASDATDAPTNCFRLIHGEADDLPGFFVDHLGPLLRVLVTSRAAEGFRERAIQALNRQLPAAADGTPFSLLELRHLRSPGGRAEVDRVVWHQGGEALLQTSLGDDFFGSGFWGRERGLRFSLDPGWDSPRRTRPGFGLFCDQRDNRDRVAVHAARGGRWLNLFAHTGAFSVALLAAGASHVESVDLSGPYLERLESNLSANGGRGVDPGRHLSHRGDSRRRLEEGPAGERFDGIVLDPPTAAAAGRRFWSVKQDLEPLVRLAVDRLDDGGALLVTQNRKGPPLGLEHLLERVAQRAHRRVRDVSDAGPGDDFPGRTGFPEGDAFEGALLTLE